MISTPGSRWSNIAWLPAWTSCGDHVTRGMSLLGSPRGLPQSGLQFEIIIWSGCVFFLEKVAVPLVILTIEKTMIGKLFGELFKT